MRGLVATGRYGPISARGIDRDRCGVATRRRIIVRKPPGVPRQADCMWVRNNKGNVFVGNLPPDLTDERLAEVFDPFGIVLSAVVARDPATGARLRYGFVDIATERAATKAIAALDGSELDGCKLNVKPRDKTPKKPPGGGAFRKPAAARAARPNGVSPNGRPPNGAPLDSRSPGYAEDFFRRMPDPAAAPPAPRLSQSQL